MIFRSDALAEFWDCYDALTEGLQEQADKQYALYATDPSHPSLRLKAIGPY